MFALQRVCIKSIQKDLFKQKAIKIKFNIGHSEIKNTLAQIKKFNDHYELNFIDGSFDKYVKFDSINRCFYGFN